MGSSYLEDYLNRLYSANGTTILWTELRKKTSSLFTYSAGRLLGFGFVGGLLNDNLSEELREG